MFSGTTSSPTMVPPALREDLLERLRDVLAERVVGGQEIPLLAVAHDVRREHRCLHRDRRVQPERVMVAVLAAHVGGGGVVADERDLQLRRGRLLGQPVGAERAAEDGDDLVLLHQLLHVLLRTLRRGFVQPDQLRRLAHDLVAAFLQRQVGAVRQIFGLRGDIAGLGQQQPDLDRVGGGGIADEWLGERCRGNCCGAQQRPTTRHGEP